MSPAWSKYPQPFVLDRVVSFVGLLQLLTGVDPLEPNLVEGVGSSVRRSLHFDVLYLIELLRNADSLTFSQFGCLEHKYRPQQRVHSDRETASRDPRSFTGANE